jgi:hypothetical protein
MMDDVLFDPDHREFLQLLNKHEVDYLLIGGVAVNLHGYHRSTGDFDVFIGSTAENKQKLVAAIEEFGYDPRDYQERKIDEITMFTLGERDKKGHIELTNRIAGITFDEAFQRVQIKEVEGISVKFFHYDDLIKSKMAAGRFKDLSDVENLRQIKRAATIKEDDTSTSDDAKLTLWEKIKAVMFPKNDG